MPVTTLKKPDLSLGFNTFVRKKLHTQSVANAEKFAAQAELGSKPKAATTPSDGHWVTFGGRHVFVKDGGGDEYEQVSKELTVSAQKKGLGLFQRIRQGRSTTAKEHAKAAEDLQVAASAHRASADASTGQAQAAHGRVAADLDKQADKHRAESQRIAKEASTKADRASAWITEQTAKPVGDDSMVQKARRMEEANRRASGLHIQARDENFGAGNKEVAGQHATKAEEHQQESKKQALYAQRMAGPVFVAPADSKLAEDASRKLVNSSNAYSVPLNRKAAEMHQKAMRAISDALNQRGLSNPERDADLEKRSMRHAGLFQAHETLKKSSASLTEKRQALDYVRSQLNSGDKTVSACLDLPVEDLKLSDGSGGGHWITLGDSGTHVFINDGGGSQHEQVADFLSRKAKGKSKDAEKSNTPEAHAAAAKSNDEASNAQRKAHLVVAKRLSPEEAAKYEKSSPRKQLATEHAAKADEHANKVSEQAHHATDTAYGKLKAFGKQKLADAKALGKSAFAHAKDKLAQEKAKITQPLHSAAANLHQIAADVQGALGHKGVAEAHRTKADEHVAVRDQNKKTIDDYDKKYSRGAKLSAKAATATAKYASAPSVDFTWKKKAELAEAHAQQAQAMHEADKQGEADEQHGKAKELHAELKAHHTEKGEKEAAEAHGKAEAHHEKMEHGEHEKKEHEKKEPRERSSSGRMGGGMNSGGGGGSGGTRRKKSGVKAELPAKHLGLSLEDATEGQYMIFPTGTAVFSELALSENTTTADGKPIKRFRKEIIREGDFQKARDGLKFKVTPKSLDHWVCTFDEMHKNGVKVWFPEGHTNKPEKNRGYWEKLEVAPSSSDPNKKALWGHVDVIGEDGLGLIGRSDVSLYSPPELVDGEGHKYSRPIVHIAACSDPVIPKLGDWQAVACSLTPVDDDAQHDAAEAKAGTITCEPGKDQCDKKDLQNFMQNLKLGDAIKGTLKRWGSDDKRTDDELNYSGTVLRVTDHQYGDSPAETSPSTNCTVVVYEDKDGEMHTTDCCMPHTLFSRVPVEELSLAAKKKEEDDDEEDDEEDDSDDSDSSDDSDDSESDDDDDSESDDDDSDEDEDDSDDDDSDDDDEDDEDEDEDESGKDKSKKKMSLDGGDTGAEMSKDDDDDDEEDDDDDDEDEEDDEDKDSLDLSVSKSPMKHEGDLGEFPASAYAYAPDTSEPSTWKLRLKASPNGDYDVQTVGAAVAALGKGFRGNKVELPQNAREGVIRRVAAAWRKANPDKEDMPEVLKLSHSQGAKQMNVARICERLKIDLTKVTPENAEQLILSGLDTIEQQHTTEKEALTLSLSHGGEPKTTDDAVVRLVTENRELKLSALIDSGKYTPAVVEELRKLYADPDDLSLSLSNGNDHFDDLVVILAQNDPVGLKEATGPQTKGLLRLSRKKGAAAKDKDDEDDEDDDAPKVLSQDADRRKAEWDAQQMKSKGAC